jgi:cysteine synthase B
MTRRLATEGIPAGVSSGAAIAAVLRVASRLTHGVVVTIFPDGAERYVSERFWREQDA